jgi:predicted Rossmann fold nucleotide-binding protein DprA/Smf involved in DNA uptake
MNTQKTVEAIRNELLALQTRQETVLTQLETLLARGTGDVTEAAAVAMGTLPERLEALLRERPHTLDDLSARAGAGVGPVADEMRKLRADRKVYNVGNEERPRWFWVFGTDATPDDLQHAATVLIQDRPYELQELAAAMGVPPGQVSTVLVRMQRAGIKVENHGSPKRARWYMPIARVRVASKQR